jgi:hypothetical protein
MALVACLFSVRLASSHVERRIAAAPLATLQASSTVRLKGTRCDSLTHSGTSARLLSVLVAAMWENLVETMDQGLVNRMELAVILGAKFESHPTPSCASPSWCEWTDSIASAVPRLKPGVLTSLALMQDTYVFYVLVVSVSRS